MTEPTNIVSLSPTNPATIAQSEAAAIVHMIERASRDPSVDLDKMERLIAMRQRMKDYADLEAFNIAMAAVQSEMRPVATDCNNPQTRSKYASYLALDRALRPIYTKYGFVLSFDTPPGAPEGMQRIVCHVSKGAHTRPYSIDMPADGKGAKGGDVMTRTHATGSAVSYGMRYLLRMIFNIAIGEADDDGNAAGASNGSISPQQLAEIIDLCEKVGADKIKFCAYMKVPSLAEIPASKFAAAVAALNAKGAKRDRTHSRL
jgi:hypothetical protein